MLNSRRYVNEALRAELTIKGYLVAWFTVAAVMLDLRAPAQGSIYVHKISNGMQKTLPGEHCAQSLAAPTEKQQQDSAQTGQ